MIALERQCNDFDNEKKGLELQIHTLQSKLDAEIEKFKQLSEAIAHKEMELNEVRIALLHFTQQ